MYDMSNQQSIITTYRADVRSQKYRGKDTANRTQCRESDHCALLPCLRCVDFEVLRLPTRLQIYGHALAATWIRSGS
jgi:hypothetical protein